ncbi:MAG: class I SAM-dependent rRNA methyltransferase [Bacteroidaceae bacterium]|nr:class I SAM-dependent rRNA methyltransferase [Bacteroidaceae bacterium]
MKKVYLKRGKDESLRRFHPWIFSGAIHHFDSQPEEGEVVEVYALRNNAEHTGTDLDYEYIATGHYQIGSIMVRVLTFDNELIDRAFYERRIASAYDVRKSIGVADRHDNDTYRLVHGEGDNLSGLIIDIYGKTAVMQAHSVGMHTDRYTIAQALKNVLNDKIENIFYKSETTLPYKAELGQENGFLLGGSADDIAIENGLKFHVDWLKGQKTGFFVDQRKNRSLLEHYAKGRSVLNMFCYTGGFSFYAMRGGAKVVHSVDSSQKAIDLTNANVQLNFPGDDRHQAFAEDAFKYLDRMDDMYDLIILDPPAFAKHKDALRNALKGYSRLNQKALDKIHSGGILFTFSCSQIVTKDNFRTAVFTAAAQAGRKVRILHQLHQPADHPINIYHPEGEYLKGLVLYVE